jgi:pyridine nucleotide-disulfide oxidoreductase family protein
MKHLLLVGAGHAHAQVLADWARAPVPGVQLSVVSPSALAPYSGMVPGWLAGHYAFEEICIDFAALAAAAGAQWLVDEVLAVDAAASRVHLASGRVLAWDVLSLNVGSTLLPPAGLPGRVLSLRPLGRLRAAWDELLAQQAAGAAPIGQVTAVGGGAAGVEALLAVLSRLRTLQPGQRIAARLVTRGELLPGLAPGAVRAARAALQRAGAEVHTGTGFDPADAQADGLLLWATGAQAHPWQRDSGLATSEQGFFRVDPQLRCLGQPQVFAVGDCAEWAAPLPKAGVYAVRMGPVLTANLKATLAGLPLHTYTPQHRFLALLATADGRAIAARGRWSLHGRWLGRAAWRWKDHIDRGFLARFRLPLS